MSLYTNEKAEDQRGEEIRARFQDDQWQYGDPKLQDSKCSDLTNMPLKALGISVILPCPHNLPP